MVRTVLVILTAVSILLGPRFARAQETFTLTDIYSLVRQQNEEIQIFRDALKDAEQEKFRAFSAILPKLYLTGAYTRSPEETTGSVGSGFITILQSKEAYELVAIVEQPVYSGGKASAGMGIARGQIAAAKKNLDLSEEDLLFRAAGVFYGVLKAQKTQDALKRNVARLEEHRRLSELRFKVGEVTESILLRAQAELAGAFAEAAEGEAELKINRRELQNLSGLPEDFKLEEPGTPEIPEGALSELRRVALKNRVELKISRVQEEIGEEKVKFARAEFLPTVSLEGRYFKRGQDPPRTFSVDESWAAAAKIVIPIFNGGLHRAELAQARARLSQVRTRTAVIKKQVELDVTRAALNLDALGRVLESRKEQLKFARLNFDMVSRQFTFGVVTNLDLLDANQLFVEAERDVISAGLDRNLSVLNLQRGTGVFLAMVSGGGETGL